MLIVALVGLTCIVLPGLQGSICEGLRELFEELELVGGVGCRALRSSVVQSLSRGRLLGALVCAGRFPAADAPAWDAVGVGSQHVPLAPGGERCATQAAARSSVRVVLAW